MLNFTFLSLSPFRLAGQKYVDLTDILDDAQALRNFLRMEKWIFDSPDQAGAAFRQFAKDFFQQNKLIKGEVNIGDRRVNLGNIVMPVLNVCRSGPPGAARRFQGLGGMLWQSGLHGVFLPGWPHRHLRQRPCPTRSTAGCRGVVAGPLGELRQSRTALIWKEDQSLWSFRAFLGFSLRAGCCSRAVGLGDLLGEGSQFADRFRRDIGFLESIVDAFPQREVVFHQLGDHRQRILADKRAHLFPKQVLLVHERLQAFLQIIAHHALQGVAVEADDAPVLPR